MLSSENQKLTDRIQFKSGPELLKKLDAYLLYLENHEFE